MPTDPNDKLGRDRPDPGAGRDGDRSRNAEDKQRGPKKRFLSIMFRCCNTYGRLYPNAEGTRFEGRCPRCGARTQAGIGPEGTDRRLFETG